MKSRESLRAVIGGVLLLVTLSAQSPSLTASATGMLSRDTRLETGSTQANANQGQVEVFLAALQKAVEAGDKRRIASMIRYPIVVRSKPRNLLIKTPAAFIAAYDRIFTPSLKRAIAQAKAETLFRNYQGVMINQGEIWFDLIGSGQVKIIALNGSAEDEKSATNEEKSKEEGPPQKAVGLKLHPKVFEMIRGLGPDGEYPLVTEINLDAVDRDTDRFKMADVKQEGMWFGVVNEDGRGFWRYQMLKQTGDRYTAEYQYNGGGTLTESSIIEFAVEKRPIKKDGKPLSIRVLHVLSYTSK